jgi:histidinol-phosphate aminotransferase
MKRNSPSVMTIEEERERLFARMSAIPGVAVRPSMGSFVFFTVAEPERVCRGLTHRRVSVRDVSKYSRFANTLRVTVGTPDENEAFLQALAEVMP